MTGTLKQLWEAHEHPIQDPFLVHALSKAKCVYFQVGASWYRAHVWLPIVNVANKRCFNHYGLGFLSLRQLFFLIPFLSVGKATGILWNQLKVKWLGNTSWLEFNVMHSWDSLLFPWTMAGLSNSHHLA